MVMLHLQVHIGPLRCKCRVVDRLKPGDSELKAGLSSGDQEEAGAGLSPVDWGEAGAGQSPGGWGEAGAGQSPRGSVEAGLGLDH